MEPGYYLILYFDYDDEITVRRLGGSSLDFNLEFVEGEVEFKRWRKRYLISHYGVILESIGPVSAFTRGANLIFDYINEQSRLLTAEPPSE